MTARNFADWLTRYQGDAATDGWAARPPVRAGIDELLAAVGATGDEFVVDGAQSASGPRVRDAAVCAELAGCPARLFGAALVAVRLVAGYPRATLGLADAWSAEAGGPVPSHPVTVLSSALTRAHDLWTGYGALSSPSPEGVAAVGRTVSLFVQRHIPAYSANPPVFGHPGRNCFAIAEHAHLHVPDALHAQPRDVACAAVSGPRALYLGGAGGQPERLARIVADGLLTAIPADDAAARACLVVINPTTVGDLNAEGIEDVRGFVASVGDSLRPGGTAAIEAMDLLPVVAGGASQTWIAVAVGPPGSSWVTATVDNASG